MNRLLYLAHSSEEIRRQALYAALSALAWQQALPAAIQVTTDDPALFLPLAGRIDLRRIEPRVVRALSGPHGYVLRAKPALMLEAARQHPADKLILADADTFFYRSVGVLFDRISDRSALLHEREYNVAQRNSPMMYRFRRKLRAARFRGAPIPLDRDMWNSGVVGLGPALFPVLESWLAFVDEVYPRAKRWALEQYAVSSLLQEAGCVIQPAADVVVHYWHSKTAHLAAIEPALRTLVHDGVETALVFVREHPIQIERPPPRVRRANFFQRYFGW